MSRYRFLRSPRWLLFTALMAGLAVLMVNLALWQLRRLDERRAQNERVTERTAEAPTPIGELLGPGSSPADVRATEWRAVTATGRYDAAHEVLIRNRSLNGQPGYHVVTPLVLADGTAVLVNRGWIPLEGDAAQPAAPPPPAGDVTITGRVRPSQRKGRFFSPTDPPEGTLAQLYRVDVPRIAQQVDVPLRPAYVELLATDPVPSSPQPELIPIPELDEGPHLSYAVQWVFFSGCVVAGWVLAVRRSAKAREKVASATITRPAGDDGPSTTTTGRHPPSSA